MSVKSLTENGLADGARFWGGELMGFCCPVFDAFFFFSLAA